MTKGSLETLLEILYKSFKIRNNNIYVLKINNEGRKFFNYYFENVFEKYDILHINNIDIKIDSDLIYGKDLIIIEGSLLDNHDIQTIIKREILPQGKIIKRDIIYNNNIFIYVNNKEEIEKFKKIKNINHTMINFYSKDKKIKFLQNNFVLEIETFLFFLLKFIKNKKDFDFENKFNNLLVNNNILKIWLKKRIKKYINIKKEINIKSFYFKYKKFCKLHYVEPPLEKTFYFYYKNINNEINYEGDNFIKTVYIKK